MPPGCLKPLPEGQAGVVLFSRRWLGRQNSNPQTVPVALLTCAPDPFTVIVQDLFQVSCEVPLDRVASFAQRIVEH